ncbi:hypothetical protein SFRURICE_021198 [Spodoptera frugiperda]|nr:hypothetical protein SFRURICE_021198 [Spodoptera frugiperda]
MYITARNAAIQFTPTFHLLCYKSHVIEPIAIYWIGPSRADAWSRAADYLTGLPGLRLEKQELFCSAVGDNSAAYTSSHTHDTQDRKNNLWIIQRVAMRGNRTRYKLNCSRLLCHRTNRAVTYLLSQ